jgi:hypothetical protein
MLWQCISAITLSVLRAIHTLKIPPNYTRLLGGLSLIHWIYWHGAQDLMWDAGGPFLPVATMVVVVVTPVVFVLRLLKNAVKALQLVVCMQCLYLLLHIVKHEYIAIQIMLNLAWLESKPLWFNETPACWKLPESSCHGKRNYHIVLRFQRGDNIEKAKRLSTSYLKLLIILDFWLF